MPNFDTSQLPNLFALIAMITYYVFIAAATFFSVSMIITMLRHAESRTVGVFVSLIYSITFLALVSHGLSLINSLNK